MAENEFGALQSCQKNTGDNYFEYSEYHVLQQNDQNLALANMTTSDGGSRSPKGGLEQTFTTPNQPPVSTLSVKYRNEMLSITHRDAWREAISQQCCSRTVVQLRARPTIAATSSRPNPKWWLTVTHNKTNSLNQNQIGLNSTSTAMVSGLCTKQISYETAQDNDSEILTACQEQVNLSLSRDLTASRNNNLRVTILPFRVQTANSTFC